MFPDKTTLWIVKVCAVLALCVAGYLWVFSRGAAHADAKHAKAAAKAAAIARATEDALHGVIYDVAYQAEATRIERETETNRTIAGLRAGTVKLRDRFTCPRLPATAQAPAGSDDPAAFGLRIDDAEFLVRESDRADAIADQLRQCQAVVQAYWKATQ